MGQRLEIYCDKISQSWTKDGKPYSAANNSLAKISNDGGYTKLQISTLKLKDAGIYACSNSQFQVEVYGTLIAYIPDPIQILTRSSTQSLVTLQQFDVKSQCFGPSPHNYRASLLTKTNGVAPCSFAGITWKRIPREKYNYYPAIATRSIGTKPKRNLR